MSYFTLRSLVIVVLISFPVLNLPLQ